MLCYVEHNLIDSNTVVVTLHGMSKWDMLRVVNFALLSLEAHSVRVKFLALQALQKLNYNKCGKYLDIQNKISFLTDIVFILLPASISEALPLLFLTCNHVNPTYFLVKPLTFIIMLDFCLVSFSTGYFKWNLLAPVIHHLGEWITINTQVTSSEIQDHTLAFPILKSQSKMTMQRRQYQ